MGTYSVGAAPGSPLSTAGIIAPVSDIAITGLTNKYNAITTDTGGTKANVNVGGELTRYDLVTNVKKNVVLLSAGLQPSTDASGQKKWCAGTTIDQAFINGTSGTATDCTVTTPDGETISFVDGNSTVNCGVSVNCHLNGRRSIIVKNGSLYVKSNVTTLDAFGNQTDGQMFLAVMAENGLANLAVDENAPNVTAADKSGWMFVDPAVTNIDAFLFAQGPMVSYSDAEGKFYSSALATDRKLRNQLHIMGSLLTLNNISGARKTPAECPYVVSNCDAAGNIAQIFDLIYLRRFTLSPLSVFTGVAADRNTMVPYHPDGFTIAKRSGGITGIQTLPPSSELRYITDPAYSPYPMLIERDLRWNTVPSNLFKVTN